MNDLISRQAAIDLFPNDALEWDTKGAYIAPHLARRMIEELPTAQPTQTNTPNALETLDCVSRQEAIDALWKALFEYEDKTEKQFQESEELGVGDWFAHRIFVQNMSDIDRQVIRDLPSAQPERKKGHWIEIQAPDSDGNGLYECSICHRGEVHVPIVEVPFCWHCGAYMKEA